MTDNKKCGWFTSSFFNDLVFAYYTSRVFDLDFLATISTVRPRI